MGEVSKEQVDAFLKGSNPQERIIKVECANNESDVFVIYVDDKGVKRIQKDKLYPFCWAKQNAGRAMFGGDKETTKRELDRAGIACKGLRTKDKDGNEPERMANGYRVMFYATRPMSHNDFLKFFKRAGTPIYGNNEDETDERNFMIVSPVEQYLISTGKRFFKGYDNYDDLHRAQWDLETEGLDPYKCMISQIGLRDNRGYEKIITIDGETREEKFENELKGIDEFFTSVALIKPDILSGHNTENFDWYFFDVRLSLHGLNMKEYTKKFFPRGVYKKDKETVLKLGGEQEYYFPTVMWGFNLTDSLFAVRRAQALDSSMKKSTLKYATKYSKIAKANRVYVDGKLIEKTWNDLESHYCFNDVNGHWVLYDENSTYRVYDEEAFNAQYEPLEYDDGYYLAIAKENYDPFDYCDVEEMDDSGDLYDEQGNFIGEYDEEALEVLKKEYYDEDAKKDREKAWGDWKKKNYRYAKRFVKDGNNVHDNVTNEDYDEFVTGRYIVERYLLDDLWETDKVECRFNESNFLVGKMLPVSFERMCTMGTAAIWKYIMMAWSYENGLAIPALIQSRKFTGGLSRLLSVGYNPRVVKLDYNSLYPSIILTYGIATAIDVMGAMAAMLDYILTQRELYKGLKAEYGAKAKEIKKQIKENVNLTKIAIAELTKQMDEASMLAARNDKLQLPLKITGNGYFGSFGSGGVFPWSDIVCAEETTCIGRQALRLMIGHFSNIGNNTKVTVKMGELTVDSVVFIKYDDDNSIERKKVSDIENDTFQRPFKILTDKGWCMNGVYEAA